MKVGYHSAVQRDVNRDQQVGGGQCSVSIVEASDTSGS
jgi:hypothetical protein